MRVPCLLPLFLTSNKSFIKSIRSKYDILAAFYSKVYSIEEENVFRYYQYTDLSDPEQFEQYVQQVKAASLYETGITAAYGEQLLTLSTCSYHTEDGRFVVVA